jgi:hypothetical protein
MKDYDIDTIMRLSNDAVLFAMLCQQYVQFKNRVYDSNELAKMGIF